MGKKKQRTKQVSKGERRCVNRSVTKATRRDYMKSAERMSNQLTAFLRGKNVMLTVPNPTQMKPTNGLFVCRPNTVWRSQGRKKHFLSFEL